VLKLSASKTKYEQASGEYKCRPEIKLLEYDERFAVFKEFVQYDFEKAMQLPPEMKGSFDRIICDPPFLSEDCQTKGTPCSNVSCMNSANSHQLH
jgi:tRNA1(Val) A37 N6-methylase TrmN6